MSGEEKEQWRYRRTQGDGAVMSSLPVPIPKAIIIKIHTFKGGVPQVEEGAKKKERKESKRRGQKVPDKSNPGGQSENKLKEPL